MNLSKILLHPKATKCDLTIISFKIRIVTPCRPHTTVKNARNMKSVSQAKLPYFEEIFKLQMFISFAYKNLVVVYVKPS